MQRILITGAFGQLGEAVIRKFHPHYELLATDVIIPKSMTFPGPAEKLDIVDDEDVKRVLKMFKPHIVVNLAAITDVDGCEIHPERAYRVNTEAIGNFLNSFSGTFIQISTDYVFNGKNGPYSEEDPTDPINVYGLTKLKSEELVKDYTYPWVIIRTNVVFDFTKNTEASFVKWVVESLKKGKVIRVVNDQWNNPTWTVALADVLHRIIANKVTGLFHYGGAEQLHRLDFAKMIAKIFELDESLITTITTKELNQPAPRPLKCGLKTNLIESKLNLQCMPLETSLRKIRMRLNL